MTMESVPCLDRRTYIFIIYWFAAFYKVLQYYKLNFPPRPKEQLQDVQDIRASRSAFAALLADRRVVTWGDAFNGDDSSEVMHLLEDAGIIWDLWRLIWLMKYVDGYGWVKETKDDKSC